MIEIHNDGPRVTATSYFATEHADLGLVYCTINAGTFRLLVPPGAPIDHAGSEYVIVTRGKWPERGWRECLEFVWEDGTQSPFHLIVDAQQVDRLPAADDDGRVDLRCVGYGPSLEVLFDLPARYRVRPKVPHLKAWEK